MEKGAGAEHLVEPSDAQDGCLPYSRTRADSAGVELVSQRLAEPIAVADVSWNEAGPRIMRTWNDIAEDDRYARVLGKRLTDALQPVVRNLTVVVRQCQNTRTGARQCQVVRAPQSGYPGPDQDEAWIRDQITPQARAMIDLALIDEDHLEVRV
jgi:hypothetical protein